MLREQKQLLMRIHMVVDILWTVVAFILAYYCKKFWISSNFGGLSSVPNYYAILLLAIIIWFVCLYLGGAYESYRRRRLPVILLNTLRSVSLAIALLVVVLYLLKIQDISRGMMVFFYVFDISLLCGSKIIIYQLLQHYRANDFNTRHILIIGSHKRAKEVVRNIYANRGSGFRVIGALEVSREFVGQKVFHDCWVLGTIDQLEQFLRDNVVDELIFAMPMKHIPDIDKYIARTESAGVLTRVIPDWQIHYLSENPLISTIRLENFLGSPTLAFHTTSLHKGTILFKISMDHLLAALFLGLLSPLMVLIALLIKLCSKGPVFYRQDRLGLNGRRFTLLKFRTMVENADAMLETLKAANEADGPAFKIKNDPRIIPVVGSVLRRTSLDELPQLINVLRGEMSFVGPRPPIPGEVDEYAWWQRRRLSMKPGITCLWQVSPLRNEISFDKWMQMDLNYIDTWSLWLDLKIILATLSAVIRGSGR
ncbi:MAG: sugar transferase [Thermodesulfobacteriota bacterium]|nr:sugar transferase [Thermodesulfobacteriota bacterium]